MMRPVWRPIFGIASTYLACNDKLWSDSTPTAGAATSTAPTQLRLGRWYEPEADGGAEE